MEEIKSILHSIKNPNTNETLSSEGRIKQLTYENGQLTVVYNRDGISPEQKRKIEDVIINELRSHVEEDNILVKTVSTDSKDVTGAKSAPQQKAPANLKAGHGAPLPQKKRVDDVKKVIAVSSGKGGVGKSTVSTNLAYALKNQGKKVGLLDADIYGPSIPMLVGQRDAKPLSSEKKKILPIEANGIKFISFGLFIGEKDPVIWRGPMLGGVLNQFLFDVEWGDLDYLIIDLPPGTGDVQLSMVQATDIDGIIGVSTPQDVALLDSTKGLKMFGQVKVPVLGVVENMSYFSPDDMPEKKYFIFGEGGAKKATEELGIPFLGDIPMEIALRESCDKGTPYMNNNAYEGRPVWKAYTEIAKKVIDNTDEGKKGFFSKILG
ncbi:Mrp/NBP35 family ATP-binding protein [Bacteriovorax sp. DB6_IX]|uniref:Mrp/NBP35 family ATP-binding protein n=1 Tax=Bacteriovorax sp. DB6_IX TaxID=1353530 RepID=UPI00038A0DCA|nr:Mrp/NBP35 family ATP-binding protein [Bacteriovorax sp. DB6_IX]EQC51524.1 ParA/MinD ATPase-like protein [Bacteriovorax sp. DB6_IX]